MVAGLAEACQVRFAERDDPEHAETRVTELVKCLSVLGTIASTEPTRAAAGADGIATESADVTMAFPPALLRRVARYLDVAATALRHRPEQAVCTWPRSNSVYTGRPEIDEVERPLNRASCCSSTGTTLPTPASRSGSAPSCQPRWSGRLRRRNVSTAVAPTGPLCPIRAKVPAQPAVHTAPDLRKRVDRSCPLKVVVLHLRQLAE